MASISNTQTGVSQFLRAYHVIGRDSTRVDTALTAETCSRLHAVIHWSDDRWFLKDLSKHGTWVDGVRCSTDTRLSDEHLIQFGPDTSELWKLEDLSAPNDLLIEDSDGSMTLALEKYVVLPGDRQAHALMYEPTLGGWCLYSADESESVAGPFGHGDYVVCGNKRWRVFTADPRTSTPVMNDRSAVSTLEIVLHTSLDEESTHAKINHGGIEHDLGFRSQHYLLLHLARVKSEEREAGIDEVSAGWMDKSQLCQQLGLSPNNLNLQIHRVQQLLLEHIPFPSSATALLLEKQRGRIRFGSIGCRVYKGSSQIAQLPQT
ncbi:MAG: FHA domain-containing protein [Pseudomonadota bacterium]